MGGRRDRETSQAFRAWLSEPRLLHQDVDPENVLLLSVVDGTASLLDFGLWTTRAEFGRNLGLWSDQEALARDFWVAMTNYTLSDDEADAAVHPDQERLFDLRTTVSS